jgi:hypothetical protein
MIIDKLLEVLSAQDMTSPAASSAVDLGITTPGLGEPIKLAISAPDAAGAGPLVLSITSCDTLAGTYTAVGSITLTTAELARNREMTIPAACRQYMKVTPSGTFSAGALTVQVVTEAQSNY